MVADESAVTPSAAGGREFWRRFRRSRAGIIGLGLVVLLVVVAMAAPLLAPRDPQTTSLVTLNPPGTPGHPLGTDNLGRDILSGVLWGSRVSLTVGVCAAAAAVLLGVFIGSLAGFYGGWADAVLGRITELFQVIPRFVLALLVVALFGSGLWKLIAVIGILSWPQAARVVRGQVMALRGAAYVDAARVLGLRNARIIFSEILPNVLAPVVVIGSLDVAGAILLEASLGFFGLGDPNLVSWGMMLNNAQAHLRQAWWMSVFPGIAISLAVLGFNLMGDGLNDAANPRLGV
ncbi:MAG: ABC transporter permease [Armatimonadetes bacterium]|nr:ABC transporter permease [Armatimonadota bacterium]